MNILTEFSQGLSTAVEKGGASTLVVDARKRYPASGIAYAEDLVLTADHVVTREEDIKVLLPVGKSLAATVAGRDPGSDLALLRLAEKALTPAKTSSDVKVGQLVLALGRPNSAGMQASWGIVTAIAGPAKLKQRPIPASPAGHSSTLKAKYWGLTLRALHTVHR